MKIILVLIYTLLTGPNQVSVPVSSLADCFSRGAKAIQQAKDKDVKATFKCEIHPLGYQKT